MLSIALLGASIANTAMPPIVEEIDASLEELLWVPNANVPSSPSGAGKRTAAE